VTSALRTKILGSPVARIAAFPTRTASVAKANCHFLGVSTRWLFKSREHTNYTYDLTSLNRKHLTWFVANIAGTDIQTARGYIEEVLNDDALRRHIADATRTSPRRWLADPSALLGRRIGWYALVRVLKPQHVVETGTDKGLGSVVLAAALLRNGFGRLTTIDNNPASGYLISGAYAPVINRVIGDSVSTLASLRDVDIFLHDSDHSADYERSEIETVADVLSRDALVMSDNAELTDELARWAERTDRRFAYFDERPANHWFEGVGIGVAYRVKGVQP
jgi:Methyltransferase domain